MNDSKPEGLLTRDTLRIFYRAAFKYKTRFFLALLQLVGAVLMGVAIPYFAGKVLAGIAQQNPDLNTFLALLAASSVLGVLANRIGFTSMMVLQARAMNNLHAMVFERLLRRSVGFHTNRISGKLISDAIDFVTAFSIFISVWISGGGFLATILVGLVVVFVNSWQLGLFLLGVVSIVFAWAGIESRTRSNLRSRRLVATKELTLIFQIAS